MLKLRPASPFGSNRIDSGIVGRARAAHDSSRQRPGAISRGQPVRCIDGDPINRSLRQYKALPTDVWLVEKCRIQMTRNELVDQLEQPSLRETILLGIDWSVTNCTPPENLHLRSWET
jgi:hypothetical protein